MHVGQLTGDSDPMANERFARHAGLALMSLGTEFVRMHDLRYLIGRHIGFK
jgi:hypothetical protein